jgi:hypothetical protein
MRGRGQGAASLACGTSRPATGGGLACGGLCGPSQEQCQALVGQLGLGQLQVDVVGADGSLRRAVGSWWREGWRVG